MQSKSFSFFRGNKIKYKCVCFLLLKHSEKRNGKSNYRHKCNSIIIIDSNVTASILGIILCCKSILLIQLFLI